VPASANEGSASSLSMPTLPQEEIVPAPTAVAMQPLEVAGEPKFSPEPGLFNGDTEVTLRCNTPGCVIHYTFDNSQPLANSPVYGAPISVKGTELTIKAFVSAPGKKDSAVVTGIYRIRE
jgi:Chitobiase/beta-hexosaminidase C-terminal domain